MAYSRHKDVWQCKGLESTVEVHSGQGYFHGAKVVALLSDPNCCLDALSVDDTNETYAGSLDQSWGSQVALRREPVHSDTSPNDLRSIPSLT